MIREIESDRESIEYQYLIWADYSPLLFGDWKAALA